MPSYKLRYIIVLVTITLITFLALELLSRSPGVHSDRPDHPESMAPVPGHTAGTLLPPATPEKTPPASLPESGLPPDGKTQGRPSVNQQQDGSR